jgi:hypothetical protein
MSHSTLNSDAIPELFGKSDDKNLSIDFPRHPEYFTKRVDVHDVVLVNNKIYIHKHLGKKI